MSSVKNPKELKKSEKFHREMLTKGQTAAFLGICHTTFLEAEPSLVARGRIVPVKIGKVVKYRRSKILESLIECERSGEAFYDADWNKAG